jgi:hypothetical protein
MARGSEVEYGAPMAVTRLRQVVVAAADRDGVREALTRTFGFGEPFADHGVGEFGLHNWVFPVGDQFVEVVSPVQENTTAGRFMARHGGDCGYMAIFQVEQIDAWRDHLRAEGVRSIWSYDGDAMGSTHIHPQDIGAAIVSFDEPRPPQSWVWAGPGWEQRADNSVVSGVAGLVIGASDPALLSTTWGRVLGLEVNSSDGEEVLNLPDRSRVTFVRADLAAPRIVGIDLWAASTDAGPVVTVAGTVFRAISR